MTDYRVGCFRLRLEPSGKLTELLLPGGQSLLHRCDRAFDLGGGRAFRPAGWDECFPTIDPAEGSGVMGDLVWLAPAVRRLPEGFEQTWRTPRYVAARTFLPAASDALELRFRADALAEPFPFLWASHALFATDGLVSVWLPDGQALDAARQGQVLRDFAPDGSCRKFFVPTGRPILLERADCRVELSTDQPYWGIWVNRAGWPAARPADLCCLGIEATNAPAEVPRQALLRPGQPFHARVTLRHVT